MLPAEPVVPVVPAVPPVVPAVPVVAPAPVVPAPPPDPPAPAGFWFPALGPQAAASPTQSAAIGAANDARGRAKGMLRIPAPGRADRASDAERRAFDRAA